jgi:cob(I)alamin adenosyltransferase
MPVLNAQRIDWLEQKLDQLNAELPPLKEFILPGGGEAASICHLARSVCRRAERTLVTASRETTLNENLLAYINRLSDLLFVMSRFITREQGEAEVYWQSSRIEEASS